MKTNLILILFCSVIYIQSGKTLEDSPEASTSAESNSKDSWKTERWIEVPLDHFNLFDNTTWNMRYFVNDESFKEGKPLFIEIGGEWTVSGYDGIAGVFVSIAKEHDAMVVATEHRYYGSSLPFSTDFSTENMRYLQLEQALEDLAYFIEHFKSSTPGLKNSKVVVHGCSYAGMLATWLRLRFPHLVDIAYASTAPLGVGLNYPEYYEALHDVYANVSISCIGTIRDGFNTAEKLLKTDDGRKIVRDALRSWGCDDVDEMSSGEILFTMLGVLNVQYDSHLFEEVSCLAMLMDSDDLSPFERLANMVVLKSQAPPGCSSESDETEEEERNNRAWSYQTCTEVGFFQTLSRENSRHPFAVDLTIEESVQDCVENFGEGITKELIQDGIQRVIRRYGGRRPKVTKLLTVQGSKDPWKVLGKFEVEDPEAPVLVLTGSHCVDTSEGSNDPPEIIEARKNIKTILSKWINES